MWTKPTQHFNRRGIISTAFEIPYTIILVTRRIEIENVQFQIRELSTFLTHMSWCNYIQWPCRYSWLPSWSCRSTSSSTSWGNSGVSASWGNSGDSGTWGNSGNSSYCEETHEYLLPMMSLAYFSPSLMSMVPSCTFPLVLGKMVSGVVTYRNILKINATTPLSRWSPVERLS